MRIQKRQNVIAERIAYPRRRICQALLDIAPGELLTLTNYSFFRIHAFTHRHTHTMHLSRVLIFIRSINPRSTPRGTSSNAESWMVIGEQKLKKWPRDLVPFYFVIYKVVFAIALTSGRGDASSEVGLAAIDLQYPYLILCQISDCQTYVNTLTKINMFDPIEVSDHISIALRYIISISLSLILNKWLMFIYWRY